MKISSMSFNMKTYINPSLECVFRELPIIQVVFALDDSLLEYKNSIYYYSKDNSIIFFDNHATQALSNGKSKEYDTLEFVKQFIVGIKNLKCFRLSTLMLYYYHTNYESKKALWQDDFYKKYGVTPPSYTPPRIIDKLKFIVEKHDDNNNKYLIAHFSKMYNINEYVLRDMIFRKFMVSDSNRNACFPIYSDLKDKNHVVGMHYKSTKYNNSFTDYKAPLNNEIYNYTTQKYENNQNFTYLHIFETPLALMKYVSLIKNKIIKYPRCSSHMFSVFNTADNFALDKLCKKYHCDNINYTGENRLYIEMVSSIKTQMSQLTLEVTSPEFQLVTPVETKTADVTIDYYDDDDDEDGIPF